MRGGARVGLGEVFRSFGKFAQAEMPDAVYYLDVGLHSPVFIHPQDTGDFSHICENIRPFASLKVDADQALRAVYDVLRIANLLSHLAVDLERFLEMTRLLKMMSEIFISHANAFFDEVVLVSSKLGLETSGLFLVGLLLASNPQFISNCIWVGRGYLSHKIPRFEVSSHIVTGLRFLNRSFEGLDRQWDACPSDVNQSLEPNATW